VARWAWTGRTTRSASRPRTRLSANCSTPQAVTAEVKTRGTWHGRGNEGLKAARGGDLETAARLLEAAVDEKHDDVTLRFNLAAVLETMGRLEDALAHYTAVVERTDGKDAEAAEAARRVRRVLKRRKHL